MKYYDLTPLMSSKLAVFPGDTPFLKTMQMDYSTGHHLQLSKLECSSHIGAHADSSSHYHKDGLGIEKRALTNYLGDAQVVEVPLRKGDRISLADLAGKKISAPRVLFKTNSFPDPNHWNDDFMSLSPELIDYLHQQKVIMVGIDTPSVDPMESKSLESHQSLYASNIAVLEGIVLTHVPEGIYTLIALPLPIEGGDASPVRAILMEQAGLLPTSVEKI